MGAWGHAAWDNDEAADWFHDLFAATKLAARVEKALRTRDVEEYAGKIRAAAYVLVALGEVYIWPAEDLQRHLRLAVARLEEVKEVDEYRDIPGFEAAVQKEIAALEARLEALGG